jgi:peptidoglycan/xylan/chitin deacetylase (PgdA/CDA1 family)
VLVKPRLNPGWYLLLYHNVSWEESPFLWHIGGTCPPDIFRDHVEECSRLGDLVSIQDGIEAIGKGKVDRPLFSFWFDDGFAGVRKYAAPILAERGITGATSVCSRFATGKELFWRLKLSYLNATGAGERLRTELLRYGCSLTDSLSEFTLTNFRLELVEVINAIFKEVVSPAAEERGVGLFDGPDQLRALYEQGWVIANHSASHYPNRDGLDDRVMQKEFEECDEFLKSITGAPSPFWVAPFGTMSAKYIQAITSKNDLKTIVLVGDLGNTPARARSGRILYRVCIPSNDRNAVGPSLAAASSRMEL